MCASSYLLFRLFLGVWSRARLFHGFRLQRPVWQSPSRGPAVLPMGREGYYIALFFEVGLPEVTSADSLTQVFSRKVRGVIERTL